MPDPHAEPVGGSVEADVAVVFVGVESTGKSTLAQDLARHMGRTLVPEIARPWLAARRGRYVEADLLEIARLQVEAETAARRTGAVVADTDLLVIRIWSETRFGTCAPWILEQLARRPPAVYVLPKPDLPWVADPLRETPDATQRGALHARYRTLLDAGSHPWHEIGGAGPGRMARVLSALGMGP